jgi:hypothetical protein
MTKRHEIEDYEDEPTIPANMSPPVTPLRTPANARPPGRQKRRHAHPLRAPTLPAARAIVPSRRRRHRSRDIRAARVPVLRVFRRIRSYTVSCVVGLCSRRAERSGALRRCHARGMTPEIADVAASTFSSSSSGEKDSVHNTVHPSAAFLLASRQRGRHDNDDEDDSLDADPDDATPLRRLLSPRIRSRVWWLLERRMIHLTRLMGTLRKRLCSVHDLVKRGSMLPLGTCTLKAT